MNKELIEILVAETIDWLNYLDIHGYNEASENDIIMAIDQSRTKAVYNQLMDISHRDYLKVIDAVLTQLTVKWKKEFA
jgi:hypothetical protein